MTIEQLDILLHRKSGLAGLSQSSGDMRELMELDTPEALLAIELYCYQIKKQIGAYYFALGGLDAICFGGGIGENQPEIRALILKDLESIGIELSETDNAIAGEFSKLHSDNSKVDVWLTPVDELSEMLRQYFAGRK